ncbi:MAG TPA: ABC transporter permease subunit [Thermohalobaculum sp.]|nr:ABC transporter permease subunit [Thermohalobaculum sp.]
MVIEARGLNLVFETADAPVHALKDIDLTVGQGDFVSFIGPSGCGKTTFLRVVADLEQPTSGTITVNGVSPHQARLNRSYGYVFQAAGLYPWRTIGGNVRLPLEIMGYSCTEQDERVARTLALVDLATVIAAIIALWYIGAVFLNAPWERDQAERAGTTIATSQLIANTMAQERPVLPAPHQVVIEIWRTTVEQRITSKRSLVFHGWITLSSTLLGFAIGTVTGILLAVGVVHNRAMEMSVMPWVVASQTIPILAIAPMIIVVLNAVGISGLLPKALISAYLSFFPVVVGMAKGLTSPDALQLDLMRTYSASRWQAFWKLRWPSSVPYLFTSMKVAVAASLVGAIVGELPTGAVAGLGARLLAGSYYGQTIQIWSALFAAAALAAALVALVGLANRIALRRMGMAR